MGEIMDLKSKNTTYYGEFFSLVINQNGPILHLFIEVI